MEITNFEAANATDRMGGGDVRPNDLANRPQVFLSGNLHGDEQVGPMTLIYLAELLVAQRLSGANAWISRLVDTRLLVMMPVTNPLGYHRIQRSENGMDPNRDFPFRQRPEHCMTTLTARAVNEVWRSHLFTSAVTFHGGMQAISYEWGAENHMTRGSESPDDRAQFLLSHVMGNMAGAFRGERYPVARINNIVYPVDGGMEDWAYAGSWDTPSVAPCNPSTYGGYPREKTVYNDAVLRSFNVLVEASDDKRPAEATLGAWGPTAAATEALTVEGDGDGHVPRNLRLSLAVIDLAAPYVHVTRTEVAPLAPGKRRDEAAAGGAGGRQLLRGFTQRPEAAFTLEALAGKYDKVQALAAAHSHGSEDEAESSGDAMLGNVSAVRRRLTVGGNAPSTIAGYNSPVSPSAAFKGPGPCIDSGSGGACSAHRDEYAHWASVTPDVPSMEVQVGWDVGGAVTVDATSALIGTWDPRLPPSLLTTARVHAEGNDTPGTPDATKAAAAAALVTAHGLTASESEAAVDYIHAWQLFLAGRAPVGQVPASAVLRHSRPVRGVSRWVFGNLGPQPRDGADGPSRLGEKVEGSPDLARAPYVTRFADCFRASLPASGSGGVSGARMLIEECAATPAPGGRAAQAAPQQQLYQAGGSSSGNGAVHAYVIVPYAAVDANWRDQEHPDPPGTAPQSHMVNARTTADWRKESGGAVVQGRLHAVSDPIFVGLQALAGAGAQGAPAEAASASPAASSAPPLPSASGTAAASSSAAASLSASPVPSTSGTPAATASASAGATGSATPAVTSSSTPLPSATLTPAEAPAAEEGQEEGGVAPAAPDSEGEDDFDAEKDNVEGEPIVPTGEGGAVTVDDSSSAPSEHGSLKPADEPDHAIVGVPQAGVVALATAAVALAAYFGAAPASRLLRSRLRASGSSYDSAAPQQAAGGGGQESEDSDELGLDDEEAQQLVGDMGGRGGGDSGSGRGRGGRGGRRAGRGAAEATAPTGASTRRGSSNSARAPGSARR